MNLTEQTIKTYKKQWDEFLNKHLVVGELYRFVNANGVNYLDEYYGPPMMFLEYRKHLYSVDIAFLEDGKKNIIVVGS